MGSIQESDGNELQRTIEKYGTTPEYVGDTPVYWDSDYWYRFTNWDKELKPITTNTYITAEYEMGGPLKKEEADNMITVVFDVSGTNSAYMTDGVYSLKCAIGSTFSITDNSVTINGVEHKVADGYSTPSGWDIIPTSSVSGNQIIGNVTFSAILMP